MNYLVHSILSNGEDEHLGNLIGDFVRGNIKTLKFSDGIKEGIILHRKIDSFSNSNCFFMKSRRKLKKYGHYSGVIIDIFYDHILAKNWEKFSKTDLYSYTQNIYFLLEKNREILPERFLPAFRYMKSRNSLYNYQNIDFIEDVLHGVSSRFKRKNNIYESVEELEKYYYCFESDFFCFFKDMQVYLNRKMEAE